MLSLPKILLFLAIAAVVVVLSKSWRGRTPKSSEDGKDGTENKAVDLSQCVVCGKFVATDEPDCGRADCPHAV